MCRYLLAFLDRSNIGNARVAGLQKNLKMTDIQYQTGKSAREATNFQSGELIFFTSNHCHLRSLHRRRTALELDPQSGRSEEIAPNPVSTLGPS